MRKGAVPCLYVGRPEKAVPKIRSFSVKRSLEREQQTPLTSKKRKNETEKEDDAASIDDQGCAEKSSTIDNEENDVNTDINDDNHAPYTNTPESFALLFKKILENENSISMPISWLRSNVSCGGHSGVTFFTRIGIKGKHDHIDSVCNKELTVDESMTVLIKINGKFVDHSMFGIESHQLHSEKDLEIVIERINKCKICQGFPDVNLSEENANYLASFSYVDRINVLRHKHCPLVLSEKNDAQEIKLNKQCKYCKTVKDLLRKKILRRQKSKNSNYLKLSELSPRKQEKLSKIAKTLKSTSRAKVRAQTNVRLLKKVVKWPFN